MHALTFQLKRSHLCAVAMGRKVFRGTPGKVEEDFDGVRDMTPARFDILYVIHRSRGFVGHRQLRGTLGLHASTISKAVKRLVQLGLVVSEHVAGDGRRKVARLTPEGRRRFRQALHLVFTGRRISRHVRAFAKKYAGSLSKRGLASRIDEALDAIWQKAIELSRHFGDRSELVYRLRYDADPPLAGLTVFYDTRTERARITTLRDMHPN